MRATSRPGIPPTGTLHGVHSADGPDQCPHHYHSGLGHFEDNPSPTYITFNATETQRQGANGPGCLAGWPHRSPQRGQCPLAGPGHSVWARVGVKNSQSLVLSGSLYPACSQVPGSCLSSGDLSSSAWTLIRSCPQERRAEEQKQSFCMHVHCRTAARSK